MAPPHKPTISQNMNIICFSNAFREKQYGIVRGVWHY